MENCVDVPSSAVSSVVSLQGVTIITVSCQSAEKSFMTVAQICTSIQHNTSTKPARKFFVLYNKADGFLRTQHYYYLLIFNRTLFINISFCVDDVEVKSLLVDHRACMLIVTLRHC